MHHHLVCWPVALRLWVLLLLLRQKRTAAVARPVHWLLVLLSLLLLQLAPVPLVLTLWRY